MSALRPVTSAVAAAARGAQSRRVVALFRALCRDVPKVLIMYGLEHSAPEVRRAVLLQFRKHAAVTEPRILESLLARAYMEREETVNQWKQKGHLLAILQPDETPADAWLDEDEFFRRFLDGSINEEMVWAGWDPRKMEERVARLRRREAELGGEAEAGAAGSAEDVERVQALLRKLAGAGEPRVSAAARPAPKELR